MPFRDELTLPPLERKEYPYSRILANFLGNLKIQLLLLNLVDAKIFFIRIILGRILQKMPQLKLNI